MTQTTSTDIEFDQVLNKLKVALPYVEDQIFRWDDVTAFLVIQLTNTDSVNKERDVSNATQIQLTAEQAVTEGWRKTEDFFPTLTLNSSFKAWRVSIDARLNNDNLADLQDKKTVTTHSWTNDTIQIRRRILNAKDGKEGNPTLHICYGDDLQQLRRLLNVHDYIVIAKQRKSTIYTAFGVKAAEDLGTGKKLYKSSKAEKDDTVFTLSRLTRNYDLDTRVDGGANILLYGVPGSGKSWTIEHEYLTPTTKAERIVFHPDYTYSDFVGQILPDVDDAGMVTYVFTPGPFTTIMREAYQDPKRKYTLIIEEINRGNAPAIFGEVFQLLDRMARPGMEGEVPLPAGTSEYAITNKNMAQVIYGDERHPVRIPANLSIIGTMNTSDQNVFTLDTAFQRRWEMRLIDNAFTNVRDSLAGAQILDTGVTWEMFCTTINRLIVGTKVKTASSEDKRLGVYFINEEDVVYQPKNTVEAGNLLDTYNSLLRSERLSEHEEGYEFPEEQRQELAVIREDLQHIRKFPEKVIKYLWDDAFRFNPEILFDIQSFDSLEDIIRQFTFSNGRDRFIIFNKNVRDTFYPVR